MSNSRGFTSFIAAPGLPEAKRQRRFGLWLLIAADLLYDWRQRAQDRRVLAQLGTRDLNDLGLGHGERAEEVDKPFWRA